MLKTTSSTLFAERECRVPILNGVTLNDGSVTWVLKDALEEIFNSDGERSVSLTGLAPELDQVSVSERLLTSFYLGRSPKFSHHGLPSSPDSCLLRLYIFLSAGNGQAAWKTTRKRSQISTQTQPLPAQHTR